MKKSKGESQRIYWQQWLSNSNKSNDGHYSRRELITSSAAIRINPDAAKAKDVTQLLRDTLNLSSLESTNASSNGGSPNSHSDALVLVGTLYSLPKEYVQFEHEPLPRQETELSVKLPNSIASSSSDPFHVIKTLRSDDNPLTVRDKMMEHLRQIQLQAPATTSTISPKVQWYFVPSSGDPSRSPIPSCIELDGYCTSMGEEDDTETDDDDESIINQGGDADETDTTERDYYDLDLVLARCPFLNDGRISGDDDTSSSVTEAAADPKSQEGQTKEIRRYSQLSQTRSSSAGYLLKQSSSDPHVWKRVYCSLTDDHLWYTSRVPYEVLPPSKGSRIEPDSLPRMGKKHGRISLGRALLLEPNSGYTASPLYRIPNSFDVVNSRGTSHTFRAPNRTIQRQWIQALSNKIMESFENSLMDHAELIVADESIARNRRFTSLAIEPLYSTVDAQHTSTVSMYLSLVQASVLRLGLDIAEYREQCRQINALLPAKQPVVVRSAGNGSPQHSMSQSNSNGTHTPELSSLRRMEDVMLSQVQVAWDKASILLDRATQVALEVQQFSKIGHPVDHKQQQQHQQSLSHSLETLCRHVNYVITGHHRPVRVPGGPSDDDTAGGSATVPHATTNGNHGRQGLRKNPPPMDLFDLLLAELHGLVHATQARGETHSDGKDSNRSS